MFRLKVLTHGDVKKSELDDIIRIKSVAWPYSYNSQKKWINDNLCDEDLHLILMLDNRGVAYLNLINITVEINNETYISYGVGNVCSCIQGCGYGQGLLTLVNKFIIESNRVGLLFCKSNLVDFYKKYKWEIVDKNIINTKINIYGFDLMVFNSPKVLHNLTYNERLF